VRRFLIAAGLLIGGGLASAAEPPAPPPAETKRVYPATYRILVKYDKATVEMIKREIRQYIKKALKQRQRRRALSRLAIEEELNAAIQKYKGDASKPGKWRLLRLEAVRDQLELARRSRILGNALLATSVDSWRRAKREEQILAEAALRRLEAVLAQIKAEERAERRERAPVVPPHE